MNLWSWHPARESVGQPLRQSTRPTAANTHSQSAELTACCPFSTWNGQPCGHCGRRGDNTATAFIYASADPYLPCLDERVLL